jgi:uncharacterized membrane protein HdeD (DUF308 family)
MTSYDEDKPLLDLLKRFWWLMACRGFIMAAYGAFVFIFPYTTTLVFIVLFTLYMLASGIIALILGYRSRNRPHRLSAFFLPGLASIIIGLTVLLLPGLAILALIGLVGIWSLLLGLTEFLLAVQLRKVLRHKLALLIAGTLSCVAGASVLLRPIYIVFYDSGRVGAAALLLGTGLIVLAVQMRHVTDVGPPE